MENIHQPSHGGYADCFSALSQDQIRPLRLTVDLRGRDGGAALRQVISCYLSLVSLLLPAKLTKLKGGQINSKSLAVMEPAVSR